MAGGDEVGTRRSGAPARQAGSGAIRGAGATLAAGPHRSCLRAAHPILAALLILPSACSGRASLHDLTGSPGAPTGSRALYRVESEGSSGSSRFRMAAALASPHFVRLEFFGQVGGVRLIVATDGRQVTILDSVRHTYGRGPDTPDTSDRMLGLALDGRSLFAVLSGVLPCVPADGGSACIDGDLEVLGVVLAEDGHPVHAVLRSRTDGSVMAEIDYGSGARGSGAGWPAAIRLALPKRDAVIHLTATQGPESGPVDSALFAPALPAGFTERPLSAVGPAPALLGPAEPGP